MRHCWVDWVVSSYIALWYAQNQDLFRDICNNTWWHFTAANDFADYLPAIKIKGALLNIYISVWYVPPKNATLASIHKTDGLLFYLGHAVYGDGYLLLRTTVYFRIGLL